MTSYGPPQSAYTTQTPSNTFTGINDSARGNDFTFAAAGRITGARLWRHATATVAFTIRVWQSGGAAELGSVVFPSTGSGWMTATFTTPIPIAAGQTVRLAVCIPSGAGNKSAYASTFSVDLVNGDITMGKQGWLGSPSTVYPTTTSATSFYGDVIFEAEVVDPEPPATVAGQLFPFGARITGTDVPPDEEDEAVIVTQAKPSGAPDAGWSVSVNGQATWAHYTGRGAVATYSTDAAGPVAVTLTAPTTVTAVEVKLQQEGIWPPPTVSPVFAGPTVAFVLPAGFYGHAMVRINNALPASGWQSFAVVGALPLETDVPASGEVTHYFGPGVHTGGQINLASNATVYVAPGALVKRRLVAGQVGDGAGQRSNIRIYGRGVVDTTNGYGPTDQGMGAGDFAGVAGLTIEGITYVSRYSWALAIYHCTTFLLDRARVYSCEVVNAADYPGEGTPDGVDFIACTGATVKRSLISASDDSSAIKCSKYGETGDCSGFLYQDVMLIQGGKSNATEIGYELGTQSVTDVTYRRVYAPISWRDSVSYRTNVFGVHLCTAGTVDGVLFEDCRADEARNKDFDLFLSSFYFSGGFGSVAGDANRGWLKNVVYRRVDFPGQKPVRIVAEAASKPITNVTFAGCTRGGSPLTAAGGDWTVTNVTGLTFPAAEDPPTPPPDGGDGDDVAALAVRVARLEQQDAELAANLQNMADDLADP